MIQLDSETAVTRDSNAFSILLLSLNVGFILSQQAAFLCVVENMAC